METSAAALDLDLDRVRASARPGLALVEAWTAEVDRWVADLFVNGTAGPQPVGNMLHGGLGLRVAY